jgi:hypothetical protein
MKSLRDEMTVQIEDGVSEGYDLLINASEIGFAIA